MKYARGRPEKVLLKFLSSDNLLLRFKSKLNIFEFRRKIIIKKLFEKYCK